MTMDQVLNIGVQLFLVAILIGIGGIPKGKESFYYLAGGGVSVVGALAIGFFLGQNLFEILQLKVGLIGVMIPMAIGYPTILVGLLGLGRSRLHACVIRDRP